MARRFHTGATRAMAHRFPSPSLMPYDPFPTPRSRRPSYSALLHLPHLAGLYTLGIKFYIYDSDVATTLPAPTGSHAHYNFHIRPFMFLLLDVVRSPHPPSPCVGLRIVWWRWGHVTQGRGIQICCQDRAKRCSQAHHIWGRRCSRRLREAQGSGEPDGLDLEYLKRSDLDE